MATAQSATAAASAATTETAEKRGRKPSDFATVGTINLSVHSASKGAKVDTETIAEEIATAWRGRGYASRVVHQTREDAKSGGNTFRVQIAPASFEFPATAGPRVSPEVMALAKQVAEATGMSAEETLIAALRKLAGVE